MRNFVAVFLFGLCVLAFSAGAQQEKRPPSEISNGGRLEIPDIIPRTLDSEVNPHPWISGAALADAAGFTIDVEYLNLCVRRGLGDRVAAANEKGIAAFNEGSEPPPFIPVTWGEMLPRSERLPSTFQQLIDSASFVAVGVVEEAVGGFFHGNPGHLLRIRIEKWSGRADTPAQEEVLFFWPGGEVNIGHATILGSLEGIPQPPQMGEMVVIFPELGWEWGSERFLSFNYSRAQLGAAAKFTQMGIQVSDRMAAQIPAVARAGSFSDFSAQLDAAISRSSLR